MEVPTQAPQDRKPWLDSRETKRKKRTLQNCGHCGGPGLRMEDRSAPSAARLPLTILRAIQKWLVQGRHWTKRRSLPFWRLLQDSDRLSDRGLRILGVRDRLRVLSLVARIRNPHAIGSTRHRSASCGKNKWNKAQATSKSAMRTAPRLLMRMEPVGSRPPGGCRPSPSRGSPSPQQPTHAASVRAAP